MQCQSTFGGGMPCDSTDEYGVFLKKSRTFIRKDIESGMTTARFLGASTFQ